MSNKQEHKKVQDWLTILLPNLTPVQSQGQRRKSVLVELTVKLIATVPEDWQESDARFWVEINNCQDNFIRQLSQESEFVSTENNCYCGNDRSNARFVRFASPNDVRLFGVELPNTSEEVD
jgi:hypothetical protein